MAVVKRYASSTHDPAVYHDRFQSDETQGHRIDARGTLEGVNGDSATSVYSFGNLLPSGARMHPGSSLRCDAIAGATSISLGIAGYPNLFMNAVDVHAGGSFAALSNVDIADMCKPLYKLAGIAVDPIERQEVILTVNNALGAGGTFTLFMEYDKA